MLEGGACVFHVLIIVFRGCLVKGLRRVLVVSGDLDFFARLWYIEGVGVIA